MIRAVETLKQDQGELDRRLLRRYALEAIEFLYQAMNNGEMPLEERIHAAEILATTAGVPAEED
jgi:hypothetical protein